MVQTPIKPTIKPTFIQKDEEVHAGYGGFSDKVFIIQIGDKHACNNTTRSDGVKVEGLAVFPDPDEATTYMALPNGGGISGEIKQVKFDDAREIAKAKPLIEALLLFKGGSIVEVHHVK